MIRRSIERPLRACGEPLAGRLTAMPEPAAPDLTLYAESSWMSPWVFHALIALEEQRLPYRLEVVSLPISDEAKAQLQPRALLAKVPGLALKEMADCETCCGFGGTFALKFGEISTRLADNKCGHIAASGADAVVLGDVGCMLNIEGRLRRLGNDKPVLHVAEVLTGLRPG